MNNNCIRHKKLLSAVMVGVMSTTMIASGFDAIVPLEASAYQMIAETGFDNKILPWRILSSSPASQFIDINENAAHITIRKGLGADKSYWDLQFRYRYLSFKKGHEYKVSFKAKAKRNGMELLTRITDVSGSEPYFVLDGKDNTMKMGAAMGGVWDQPVKLKTEYQEFSGTFIPTRDISGVEWTFFYAEDHNGYGGNAQSGDEIWLDEMSIEDVTDPDSGNVVEYDYGIRNRQSGSLKNNYISVNQIGYYPELAKIAVLSDDAGDWMSYTGESMLTEDTYTWELVDAKSDEVAASGTTGKKFYDEDSHDNICKIDFSDWKQEGRYFLRIKGTDWRSLEFDISNSIYNDESHNMLTNALNFFYQCRSGMNLNADCITSGDKAKLARAGHRMPDTGHVMADWQGNNQDGDDNADAASVIDATGGWYESDRHEKNLVSGGIAAWTLQNMYERSLSSSEKAQKFADGSGMVVVPEAGNQIPDILDECRYEIDFMSKMKVEADEPVWGEFAGMYYHGIEDEKSLPIDTVYWDYIGSESYDIARLVNPPTFAATLNYAACAAQAARLWNAYDKAYAETLLQSAKEAYAAYEKHWYEAATNEETITTSQYAPSLNGIVLLNHSDTEVRDDAYWAACELFVSASELGDADASVYLEALSGYQDAFKISTRINGGNNLNGDGSYTLFNWGNTASAGTLTLALHPDLLTKQQRVVLEHSILKAADDFIQTVDQQGYGIPYINDMLHVNDLDSGNYEYGSNARALANMMAMAYAYDLSGEEKYINGVVSGMNYLLGCNPLAFSYVSGYGAEYVQDVCHVYWANALNERFPKAPDGVLVSGPNAEYYDEYLALLGFVRDEEIPPQRLYVDSVEAWTVNDTSLAQNATLAWAVSFLQEHGDATDAPEITQTTTQTTSQTTQTTSKKPETSTQKTQTTTVTAPTTTQTAPSAAQTTSTVGQTTYTTFTTANSSQTEPANIIWGDCNCNGETDVSDAVLLARFLAEDPDVLITTEGKECANVIQGELDTGDLLAILKIIAKILPTDQLPLGDDVPVIK